MLAKLLVSIPGLVPIDLYGELRVKFRKGEPVMITVERDYKMETLPDVVAEVR